MVGAQWDLRLLVGPADTGDIDQVAAAENRPGDSGQQVVVNIALHGRLRRLEIIGAGRHLEVFHIRFLFAAGCNAAARNALVLVDV